MKKYIVFTTALSLMLAGNAYAGSITKGPDNRGVTLHYEGLNVGSNGVVRFNLECVKNWGGQTGGVATVVAYYLDDTGELKEKSDSVSCHVKGGLDGARQKSSGSTKSINIPAPLAQAEVRAYIDYQETSNIDDALKNIESEVNKAVEQISLGEIKKPLSVGKSLEKAVAPAGGDKLTF